MFTRPHLFQSKELCIVLKGWITNTPTRPTTPPLPVASNHRATAPPPDSQWDCVSLASPWRDAGCLSGHSYASDAIHHHTLLLCVCVCVRLFVSMSVCLSLPPCINRNSPAESQIFNYQKAAFPSLFLLFHCKYYFSMTQLWWFTTKLVRSNTRIFIDSQAWE